MPKVKYSPMINDVRGKLGRVYFVNRFGQPVMCTITPPSNQNTPARTRQRDFMRLSSSWWHWLPAEMKDYYGLLADFNEISSYDLYTTIMINDLAAKPTPRTPSFFPGVPPVTSGLLGLGGENWGEGWVYVYWDPPVCPFDWWVRFLAVRVSGGQYEEILFEPVYDRLTASEGANFIFMPYIEADFIIFAFIATPDELAYSPAASCIVSTS